MLTLVLFRLVGATSRGRLGSRRELAQGAKVGYSSRRTSAIHVALPPPLDLGTDEDIRNKGAALRGGLGNWAHRRLVASHYAKTHGSPPLR